MPDHQRAARGTITLAAVPASAAKARQFVSDRLRGSRHGDLEDAAVLCVTELIANVTRHTSSRTCQVTVVDEPHDVLIEVSDDTPDLPRVGPPRPDAEYGRGLRIVAALAGEWGVRRQPGDGKAVWLRLCD